MLLAAYNIKIVKMRIIFAVAALSAATLVEGVVLDAQQQSLSSDQY